ncbi:MAG: azurin [Bacteroidota bacterium]
MKKLLLLLITISFITIGCSDDKKTNTTPQTEQKGTPKTTAKKETKDIKKEVTIQLAAADEMLFNQTKITVYEGQEVTVVLKHVGRMNKNIMGHNFVLLKKGTNMTAFANKAMVATDREYIPEGDEVIAHTKLIGGGETTSITFTAPAKGIYDYVCSFPGHAGMMKGKFVVK